MTSPLDALPADVRQALRQGDALEAIKRLRHARGVSLKSAKRHIDGVVADPGYSAHLAQSAHAAHSAHSPAAAPLAPPPLPGRARPRHDDLAPGEMPRSRDAAWAWWAFLLLIVAGYLRWRGWF